MKAHCEKARNEYEEEYYQLGYKAGIREVVEWIERQGNDEGEIHAIYSFTGIEWKAKLKDWGIK